MAADLTFSANLSTMPAHYNGPLTVVDASAAVVIGAGYNVATMSELGSGGGGGGSTRPSTGMLYPRYN